MECAPHAEQQIKGKATLCLSKESANMCGCGVGRELATHEKVGAAESEIPDVAFCKTQKQKRNWFGERSEHETQVAPKSNRELIRLRMILILVMRRVCHDNILPDQRSSRANRDIPGPYTEDLDSPLKAWQTCPVDPTMGPHCPKAQRPWPHLLIGGKCEKDADLACRQKIRRPSGSWGVLIAATPLSYLIK